MADDQKITGTTWEAFVLDRDGFVMSDEHIRGWCAATDEGESYFETDAEPTYLVVATGSALPSGEGINRRAPSRWMTSDRFLEETVDTHEGDELLHLWERAQAAAAAMNAAGVAA